MAARTHTEPAPASDTRFFGHPRGLATLFFTEMWERFSFYGMRAILILFMTAPAAGGGLGFSVATAGVIYGLYTSMVYFLSVPGGWVADKIFGQRRAILYGGILIVLGQFSLGVPRVPFFYLGLLLLILGTGLLKPNVSTVVGQLYAAGDVRRDAGFSIFYMGINLGASISPLASSAMSGSESTGTWGSCWRARAWRWAWFSTCWAAVTWAMRGCIRFPAETSEARAKLHRTVGIGVAALVALIGVPVLLQAVGAIHITAAGLGTANGVALLAVTIAIFGWLLSSKEWTPIERKRLIAIAALFVASVFFWSAYEQAGSTLTLLADRSTDNHAFGLSFPSSWYQSVPAIFVILLAPVFASIWLRFGQARSIHARQVFRWARVGWFGIRGSRHRGRSRGPRCLDQSVVADRSLLFAGLRRNVFEPGGAQRLDQTRAAASGRLHDGCMVRVDLNWRLRRRLVRLGVRKIFAADAVCDRCGGHHRVRLAVGAGGQADQAANGALAD